jgi:hypothetical protein
MDLALGAVGLSMADGSSIPTGLKMDEVQPVEPYRTGTLIRRAKQGQPALSWSKRVGRIPWSFLVNPAANF